MGNLQRRRGVGVAIVLAVAVWAAPAEARTAYRAVHAPAAAGPSSPVESAAAVKLTLRASRRFVLLGRRHALGGRLTRNGRALGGRLVRLQADPYPFGNGFRTLASARTARDGGYRWVGPPKRNTRFRVVAPRLNASSRRVLVYADYWGRERHSWRRGRLRMSLLIYTPFGAPGPGRRKIHFYLTQNGATTMPRVASARMRRIPRGYMRARAVARTRRPQRGELVWACWREETADGFGRPNPLDPVCGDDVVTTPPPP